MNCIIYSDDILISDSAKDTNKLLKAFDNKIKRQELKINVEKTKVMIAIECNK